MSKRRNEDKIMDDKRKVEQVKFIPSLPKLYYSVGIYCRISTRSQEQLRSMANQVSWLTQKVSENFRWRLVDIYLDFRSGTESDNREEFQRMIKDCKRKKLDIVLTKSISRFGRNTAEILDILQKLTNFGTEVIFDEENISTASGENTFIISLIEAIAQEESENRSQNVYWGIKKKVIDGTSKIYTRKCYGYNNDDNGELVIQSQEAGVVQLIFDMYLQDKSIVGIKKELEKQHIPSPSGKEQWYNRTIDSILSNEKYVGDVIIFKTYTTGFPNRKRITNSGEKSKYLSAKSHPAIISREDFDAVQEEKSRRSNVIRDEDGIRRKNTKYSSKKEKQ